MAKKESDKRRDCSKRSQEAFRSGSRALAKQLSDEGKKHGKQMDRYNKRARNLILKVNNARMPMTTIDLHGLFVQEAVRCVLKRMNEAKAAGEERLGVIVGKGNHAQNGAKIKPAVEELCRKRGLTFTYDSNRGGAVNEGKIVILLEDYEVEKNIEDSDVDLNDISDSGDEEEDFITPSARLTSPAPPQAPPTPRTPVQIRPLSVSVYNLPPTPTVPAQTRPPVVPMYSPPPPAPRPPIQTRPPVASVYSLPSQSTWGSPSQVYSPPPRPISTRPHAVPPPAVHAYNTLDYQSTVYHPPSRPAWTQPVPARPVPVRQPYRYNHTIAEEEAGASAGERKGFWARIFKPIPIFVVTVLALYGMNTVGWI